MNRIPTASRRVVAASVAAVLVLTLGATTVVAGQARPLFPSGLVAPVLSADQSTNLDITALYGEVLVGSDDLELTVEFGSEVQLPPDGFRLSVGLGEPGGEQTVAVVRTEAGNVLSRLESGPPDALEPVGPLSATVTGSRIAVLIPTTAIPDAGYVWATSTVGSPPATFATPIFPLADFLGTGEPSVLHAADRTWTPTSAGDQQSVLELPPSPDLHVQDGEATLTYRAPLPTDVAGVGVTGVVDVIRVAPDYLAGGQAPYLIAADYSAGVVKLLDATQPIPLSVDIDGDWLLEGSAAEAPVEGSVLTIDLDAAAAAFGITMSDDATAVGAARSVVLDDGSAVQADGVLGTLGWFADPPGVTIGATDGAGPAPAGPAAGEETSTSSDDGVSIGLLAAVAAVLAMVAVAVTAWFMRRRSRDADPHPNVARQAEDGPHIVEAAVTPPLPTRADPPVQPAGAPRLEAETRALLADLAGDPDDDPRAGEGGEPDEADLFGVAEGSADRREIDLNAINDSLFGHQR